jgi:hypothetical protein
MVEGQEVIRDLVSLNACALYVWQPHSGGWSQNRQ